MGAKKALIAGIIAAYSAAAVAQEFTPFEIEDMIKSGFASCFTAQLKNPANDGASQDLLRKYCQCSAHKMAARATRAETEAHVRGELLTSAQIKKIQAIGRECQQEIAR